MSEEKNLKPSIEELKKEVEDQYETWKIETKK